MMFRSFILAVLILCSLGQAGAEQRYIVRVPGGLSVLENACRLLRCSGMTGIGDPQNQLFVIKVDDRYTVDLLTPIARLLGVLRLEPDRLLSILTPASHNPSNASGASGLSDRRPVNLGETTAWSGYVSQPAAKVVRAEEARARFFVHGWEPVAVIDTGVDPTHPALRAVLLPGYDFTRSRQGGSELADLSQSTTAVVDNHGRTNNASNNVVVAGLDQSTTAVVDDPRHRAFGHGTMVAGIVHLVAPKALILPLKAFGSDGTGYTSDIIRAVYFAVSNNARVINMSFSMPLSSPELSGAISHAFSRRVVCVSSAGNEGRKATVYPASLDTVAGVGSTNLFDRRSSFSNYGDSLVWLAAPGEQIISTYPYGAYASASGTSFSTPFVAGAAALLVDLRPSVDHGSAARALAHAKAIDGEMGNGRLDVYKAIAALQTQW